MAGSNFSVGGVAEKVVGGVLSGLILLALAGGIGMGWIRLEDWWWAAPLVYALVTGGLIFGILYGLLFQIRARLYWSVFTVLLACMFGILLYVDSGGLKQTAVVPSSASSMGIPTPCQVPLTKKDRERILAFLYGQFSKGEPVKREIVRIVVGPGRKDSCPYATDLQRVFSTGGWAKDKIKIEESDPQGAAVWFQGPLDDELALTFFERVLCHTSQEVYHQRHPSLGVGQWQFFIGDGYGVSDYAKYRVGEELHEVTCPEDRIGRESPPQRKQMGRQ